VSELIFHKSATLSNHPLFNEAALLAKEEFSIESVANCIDRLKQYSEKEIFQALEAIQWQQQLATEQPVLLDWTQITRLSSGDVFDIGCHTETHQRLDKDLSIKALTSEICRSHRKLKEKIPEAVDIFCYPNGGYNEQALELVKNTYNAAVTIKKGINSLNNFNLHEIARIGLHEHASYSRNRFRARLSGW
jgi:peptidoglycan/xylan/chitin deacetylase (PgdA/CDA1 family)